MEEELGGSHDRNVQARVCAKKELEAHLSFLFV